MKSSRNLLVLALVLFGIIGAAAVFKKKAQPEEEVWVAGSEAPIALEFEDETTAASSKPESSLVAEVADNPDFDPKRPVAQSALGLPDADRIDMLFRVDDSRLPIVETIRYTSSVPWLKGRPAWVVDYASHYRTSRHFIARSLANGVPTYTDQPVNNGDHFNVLRQDHKIQFHLVVDLSRARMWFYSYDENENERVLLKTYPVGLGRPDSSRASGFLTPTGTYLLGDRIATYKPGAMGSYAGERTEMIRVFGTRWIPFEKAVGKASAPAKGYGIHGLPFVPDQANKQLVEQTETLGKYESDGCIRLATQDVEELYSIIVTRPTYIQIVKDFAQAELPGEEAYY